MGQQQLGVEPRGGGEGEALRSGGEWGMLTLYWLLAVVWATDIMAFVAGRTIGGPKLAPRVSPNKTISGALGGLASAVAAALLVDALFGGGLTTVAVGGAAVLAAGGLAAAIATRD